MRKLASIQVIDALSPIQGKDRIELATVLGWSVIVQKGYSVGDKVVYVEIDSVLPEKPEFEFLRSKNFRIRTMKMSGLYSQGIVFPMSILPVGKYSIGQDVTDIIGIKQYEPDMDNDKEVEKHEKKNRNFLMRFKIFRKLFKKTKCTQEFPIFIRKTDEIRIQTNPDLLKDKDNTYILTEKVDGCSATYCLKQTMRKFRKPKYEFYVCSRNMRLPYKDNSVYWLIADKYDIEKKLKQRIGNNTFITIQGECIGPKIQKNKYKLSNPDFYVFNYIESGIRFDSLKAKQIVNNMGMKFVPIVCDSYHLPDAVDEMIKAAHGISEIGETLREGLVVRKSDGSVSFKAVDPEFLLYYNS